MHPLLARGLELGIHADGMGDEAGARLEVEERPGGLRCAVRGPGGRTVGVAWRWPPRSRREPRSGGGRGDGSTAEDHGVTGDATAGEAPSDSRAAPLLPPEVPFLPGLSGVAVRDGSGLTVTWPAPPRAMGVPGGGALLGDMAGPAPGASRDPVAEAWSRYAAEGGQGGRAPRLREGLERLVRSSRDEGWTVVEDERIEGALEARIIRMRRGGAERSATLSRALGVSSLVMLERPGRG